MRIYALCVRTQTSKVPTSVALLFILNSLPTCTLIIEWEINRKGTQVGTFEVCVLTLLFSGCYFNTTLKGFWRGNTGVKNLSSF